jgi:hypothetical protein
MLNNSKIKTPTTIALAFASLLAVGATAMAAPHHADRAHVTKSRVQSAYDARAEMPRQFNGAPASADEALFERAKGNIE